MKSGSSYYDIACNDLGYLEAIGDTGYYNQPAALCQQIVEKLLKSLIEELHMEEDITEILKSQSLTTLGRALKNALTTINLEKKDLAYLTNYYFDTRYPGPDYHIVSKEDFEECKRIVYAIKQEVDRIRSLQV